MTSAPAWMSTGARASTRYWITITSSARAWGPAALAAGGGDGPERDALEPVDCRRLRNAAKVDGGPVVQGPRNLLAAHVQQRSPAKSTAFSQLDGLALHRALDRAINSAGPAEGPRHVVSHLLQDHHHFRGVPRLATHPRSVDGVGNGAAKSDGAPTQQPGNLLAARPQQRSLGKTTARAQLDGVAVHRAVDRAIDTGSTPAEGPRHFVSGLLQAHHKCRGTRRRATHPRSADVGGSASALGALAFCARASGERHEQQSEKWKGCFFQHVCLLVSDGADRY